NRRSGVRVPHPAPAPDMAQELRKAAMNRVHTLLAHPGATSLLFPLAAALQAIDSRSEFHTGLYFDLAGPLGRTLKYLPPSLARGVRRQLGRRYRPDIDARSVRRHPW